MIERILAKALMGAAAAGALGCGSSTPVTNVAGSYMGPVVNGTSTCPGDWNTGQMADVTVTVVQTNDNVSLRLTGVAALALGAQFGSSEFNGKVSGAHIDALLIGSTLMTQSDCKYTFNGNLSADFDGKVLSGSVAYTPVANGSPDCSANVNGCSRQQTFALTLQPTM